MGKVRIGTSGWNYRHWVGVFYPESLPQGRHLAFLGERLDTVEINRTFYSLAKPSAFRRWRDAMASDAVLSVKGSRFITHNKKLLDVETPLANFVASGILELGEKLGPILWQLPGNIDIDLDRIDDFLRILPHDTEGLAELARRHDDRVSDTSFGVHTNHRVRHVLEIRHENHFTTEIAAIARRHGVALAFSHASEWPYIEEITAGFVYLRLHGPEELYASGYGDAGLERWAQRIRRWKSATEPDDAVRLTDTEPPPRKGRDVYVYFDNDGAGYAPLEAMKLRRMLDEI